MEKLVQENEYEIVVPLFGAAFAAPKKGTPILYWYRSLSTVLSSTENRRIQGLCKAFEWFSSTFQGRLRTFQESTTNSSTFQACANTEIPDLQIKLRNIKTFFYSSTKTYVAGTQKNHFNEMALLSIQN